MKSLRSVGWMAVSIATGALVLAMPARCASGQSSWKHVNSTFGFRVDLPTSFSPIPSRHPDRAYWMMRRSASEWQAFVTYSAPLQTAPQGDALKRGLDQAMGEMINYIASNGGTPTVAAEGQCSLDSADAQYALVSLNGPTNGSRVTGYLVMTVHQSTLYGIGCLCPTGDYNGNLSEYRKIIGSFRWSS